jgi:hypothetical protein
MSSRREKMMAASTLGGAAGLAGVAVLLAAPRQELKSPSLRGLQIFPPDNPWNQPIDREPVDPHSDLLIASIGAGKPLHPDFGFSYGGQLAGIPYCLASTKTPKVPVTFEYAAESDPGPYPIPAGAPIEGGPAATGDRHILVIDRDNKKLYELFYAYPKGKGYDAGSGAIYDLTSNKLRPAGWTSADAAGLPIFPGLVRYDEVMEQKRISHALRFTVQRTRRAYVAPARHYASANKSAALPPMGMRVRLKASYDLSRFPPTARIILQALKIYGMILADNGSDWFLSGAPDSRWNSREINTLKQVRGSDFEVVRMGPLALG